MRLEKEVARLRGENSELQSQITMALAASKTWQSKYNKLKRSFDQMYAEASEQDRKSADTDCLPGQFDLDKAEEEEEESTDGDETSDAVDTASSLPFFAFSRDVLAPSSSAPRRGERFSGAAAAEISPAARGDRGESRGGITKLTKKVEQALERVRSPTPPKFDINLPSGGKR